MNFKRIVGAWLGHGTVFELEDGMFALVDHEVSTSEARFSAIAGSLLRGYADPTDKEAKRAEYEAVREMTEEFAQQNGSIICRELLGLGRDVNYVPPSDRSTEYYKKRPCPKLCACAAGILAQYLETHP